MKLSICTDVFGKIFEIERPKGDTEEVIVDTEQLNLF